MNFTKLQRKLLVEGLELRRRALEDYVQEAGKNSPSGGVVFSAEFLERSRARAQAEAQEQFDEIDFLVTQLSRAPDPSRRTSRKSPVA